MRKGIVIAILILFGIGIVDAGLSDSFFCHIEPDQVVISLNKTQGFYRCRDTISSLDSLIVQAVKDLTTVQTYIDRGRDISYRRGVQKEKLSTIERLQLAKKDIIENMKTFENNLVIKTVYYFILSITPYRVNLQHALVKIDAMTGTLSDAVLAHSKLLKEQIDTIDVLSVVETVDELIPLLNRYIYLKKEIAGKYE